VDHLERVASAELSYRLAKRITRSLYALTALASVGPWVRALDLWFVPRSLSNLAVSVWGALLLGALASRVEQWQLRREWRRCMARKEES
jgi:hypothetical protein